MRRFQVSSNRYGRFYTSFAELKAVLRRVQSYVARKVHHSIWTISGVAG